jgi:predicted transcriptional regulator
MQLMAEKGLLTRDESERSHIYHAAVGENKVKRKLIADLLERAFDGSAASLIQQLLSSRRASANELAEIRTILDQHTRQRGER